MFSPVRTRGTMVVYQVRTYGDAVEARRKVQTGGSQA
jgi:hypothetical protein